ncbi:MAG: ribbon-helix-helix domain-containing protein [Pseudomonadota bacterium]|nr:ribbon-helix-helix domain-containing protein [Pseudomonadota bacterium]
MTAPWWRNKPGQSLAAKATAFWPTPRPAPRPTPLARLAMRRLESAAMRTVTLSLPDGLKAHVDARVKARGYSSASEYMRELVRRDEEQAAEERFVAGIDSARAEKRRAP